MATLFNRFNIPRAIARIVVRNFSVASDFPKAIQVCILGADTPLGRTVSFLLKQNPIVSSLKLQGDYLVSNIAADLGMIDTKCKVHGFDGNEGISKALMSADIILMLSKSNLKEDTSLADRILTESRRVYELTQECIKYAPRALLIVNVNPVSVMTPLVANIFKQSNWYHPGRIIGSAALAQVKANTVFGRGQDLDPYICKVPIIGGPDVDLAVPLFSRAKPIELNDRIAKCIFAKFRDVDASKLSKTQGNENHLEKCSNSEAYAINNMLSCIGAGLCGSKEAYYNAFVRTSVIDTCRYLVTTLQFSRGGVVHNFGLPQLTELELDMFEKASLAIKKREEMAEEILQFVESGSAGTPSFKLKDTEKRKMLQQSVISN